MKSTFLPVFINMFIRLYSLFNKYFYLIITYYLFETVYLNFTAACHTKANKKNKIGIIGKILVNLKLLFDIYDNFNLFRFFLFLIFYFQKFLPSTNGSKGAYASGRRQKRLIFLK